MIQVMVIPNMQLSSNWTCGSRKHSSGQDLAGHLYLKDKRHYFKNSNVHIPAKDDRWFKRGVKEAICVKLETITYHSVTVQCWHPF